MKIFEKSTNSEHEKVLVGRDADCGYHGIIAIHSTALGPAVGGTRFWNYSSEDDAVLDALRLSRGMTYKNALAGLPLGGGKSIIIGDNKSRRRAELLKAHGRFIASLGGSYTTGEDVGTSPADMEIIRQETRYVAGTPGGAGDPSPVTAYGVLRAIQAARKYLTGSESLTGITVAIQGCGHVGYFLAKALSAAGSKLIATDVEEERLSRVVKEFDAVPVLPDKIFGVRSDVFAPCALGGVINDTTSPQFRVDIVAGAANNQLSEERHAELLSERGILYVPDYAANAGGVIHGCTEILGWSAERTSRKVEEIYDTILTVLEKATAEGISTQKAADQLAEKRLRDRSCGNP
jgi:leucine dehydrogenase